MNLVVSKEDVVEIITAATHAPSGDNSQPWRFVFRTPDTIEFHAISGKDNVLLNVDESGTLVALGAAIQNAELKAQSLGYVSHIQYATDDSLVASLRLQKGDDAYHESVNLARAISVRHSNRKPYKTEPFFDEDRQKLLNSSQEIGGVSCVFVEEAESMNAISRALTAMEEIALQNKLIHNFFFSSIFWSSDRNEAGEHGLYIKTLELPPPAQALFRVLRFWPVAKLLSYIGFPKMVAETNAKQNASASAFGVISLKRFDRESYIEAGRLLERVWLTATARGMSLQIVTGLLFLARALERDSSSNFSALERERVQEAYARIRENLKSPDEPFLIFRIGYGDTPSAVSYRKAPDIAFAD